VLINIEQNTIGNKHQLILVCYRKPLSAIIHHLQQKQSIYSLTFFSLFFCIQILISMTEIRIWHWPINNNTLFTSCSM